MSIGTTIRHGKHFLRHINNILKTTLIPKLLSMHIIQSLYENIQIFQKSGLENYDLWYDIPLTSRDVRTVRNISRNKHN